MNEVPISRIQEYIRNYDLNKCYDKHNKKMENQFKKITSQTYQQDRLLFQNQVNFANSIRKHLNSNIEQFEAREKLFFSPQGQSFDNRSNDT